MVVMDGHSCMRGREFESQLRILGRRGPFIKFFVVKLKKCLNRQKICRSGNVHFKNKHLKMLNIVQTSGQSYLFGQLLYTFGDFLLVTLFLNQANSLQLYKTQTFVYHKVTRPKER